MVASFFGGEEVEIIKQEIPKRINAPGTKIIPKGIILHYIGNPGTTARQNASYFSHVNSQISVHYIVDDTEIIEIIPPEQKSYGTSNKEYNESYIQIEMCHPDASGKVSEATLTNTVWLCRELMGRFSIHEIIRHYDVTGKQCPLWYVKHPDEWEKLKERILEEEFTVSQYEEIMKGIERIGERLDRIEAETVNRMIYNYVDENMPEWARGTVQKLMDKGYLRGTEEGLNLDDTMLRILVILDRARVFGE